MRPTSLRGLVGALALVGASGIATAQADEQAGIALKVVGDCPTSTSVSSALEPLLPQRAIAVENGEVALPNARAMVTDLGSNFEATVADQHRVFADEGRDCDERARSVAVWIALALDPPKFVFGQATPPPVAVPVAPPSTASLAATVDPRSERRVHVELVAAGAASVAPQDGVVWSGGASVRFVIGGDRLAGTLGLGVLSPGTETVNGGIQVSVVRVPIDLSFRLRGKTPRLTVAADLGLALVPFSAAATSVVQQQRGSGIDIGGRAALELGLARESAVRPFLALELIYVPVASRLEVTPVGDVGGTPNVWIGLSIGAALRIL